MQENVLSSFFLKENSALIDKHWTAKSALVQEIMRKTPLRQMRPDLVGDRTRLDLLWSEGVLGLYTSDKTFVPIEANLDSVCPEINAFLEDFQGLKAPFPKAAIRFRFARNKAKPDGIRGLWIDMANEEIKNLLSDGNFLDECLSRNWVIELGQKHKSPQKIDEKFKFSLAEPQCWLPSFNVNNEEVDLKTYVSLFSQSGPEANRALIAAGIDLLDEARISQTTSWEEWGAGYGNLTAAMASRLGPEALASEMNEAASKLLKDNAYKFFAHVNVAQRDAEKEADSSQINTDLWLIDPPRSGFPELLRSLSVRRPRWILSYHCHMKGLLGDTRVLAENSYKLVQWSSVDAFPATPHIEIISLWERKT